MITGRCDNRQYADDQILGSLGGRRGRFSMHCLPVMDGLHDLITLTVTRAGSLICLVVPSDDG